MENLNYKLKLLFRDYLIRKEKEKTSSYNNYYNNSWLNSSERYDGVIYFYEWSDINRSPTMFYTIGAFDNFLKSSGIFIQEYQKDVIKKLSRAYITCKKGTHELLIRGERLYLADALKDSDSSSVDSKTATEAVLNTIPVVSPASNFINRRPPMYNDTEQWYG
jgi:hypothetical protein